MNEIDIARRFVSKHDNAKRNGWEFELSFTEFKKLMNKKKCEYSGLVLTETDGTNKRTIDRIDNSKGYIKGNVRVVAECVNLYKATLENPNNPLNFEIFEKMYIAMKQDGLFESHIIG